MFQIWLGGNTFVGWGGGLTWSGDPCPGVRGQPVGQTDHPWFFVTFGFSVWGLTHLWQDPSSFHMFKWIKKLSPNSMSVQSFPPSLMCLLIDYIGRHLAGSGKLWTCPTHYIAPIWFHQAGNFLRVTSFATTTLISVLSGFMAGSLSLFCSNPFLYPPFYSLVGS